MTGDTAGLSSWNKTQRISLGTAQFGLDYGLTNSDGQVNILEAQKIIDAGFEHGLELIDTAASYGDSEDVLGELSLRSAQIVTKLPSLNLHTGPSNSFVDFALANSLSRLQRKRIFGLLVHDPRDLEPLHLQPLSQGLGLAKERGFVEKVGVSVYHPEQLSKVLETFTPDIVQLPLSLVDRRFLEQGWLKKLHDLGIEVHARSIFLQGALLADPKTLPTQVLPWRQTLQNLDDWCNLVGVTKQNVCAGFALAQQEVTRIVVGATSAAQFTQVLFESRRPPSDFPDISSKDLSFIDPTNWKI